MSVNTCLLGLRPAGWEKPGWRRWCWTRMTTCGWVWDINTSLRCRREWLSPPAHKCSQTKDESLLSPKCCSGYWELFLFLVLFVSHYAQSCDSLTQGILCQQKDEHWRKGKGVSVLWILCLSHSYSDNNMTLHLFTHLSLFLPPITKFSKLLRQFIRRVIELVIKSQQY